MLDSLMAAVEKLRQLRPDDSITGIDALDHLMAYKHKRANPEQQCLDELTALFKPLDDFPATLSEQTLENYRILSPTDLIAHYLILLKKYICHLGGTRQQRDQHYHQLWNPTLMRHFSPDHMLLIHWLTLGTMTATRKIPPKLLESMLCNQRIPYSYRRWYYLKFYNLAVSMGPQTVPGTQPHYRDRPKGNFQCSTYEPDAYRRMPECLRNAIAQDSIAATDILLTTLNKKWSAGIFALASNLNAVSIIRHMTQSLPLANGNVSVYDCVLYAILSAGIRHNTVPIKTLEIMEEARPGLMKNYHDPYGNNLLRFVFLRRNRSPELTRDIRDFLIRAGCDPAEKNNLGFSFNDCQIQAKLVHSPWPYGRH